MKLSLDSKALRSAVKLAVSTLVFEDDRINQECHIVPLDGKVLFYSSGRATVAIEIESPGTNKSTEVISLYLYQLERILSPFTKGSVELNATQSSVKFKAEKTTAELGRIASDELIDATFSLDVIAIVDRADLVSATNSVSKLCTPEYYNGLGDCIQFIVDEQTLTLQTTDGVKYGCARILNKYSAETSFVVKGRLIYQLLDEWNGADQVIISRKGNSILFGQPNSYFGIPTIESNFKLDPDKAREVLTAGHQSFNVSRDEFLDAVEAAYSLYRKVKDAKSDVKVEVDISKFYISVSTCVCPSLNFSTSIGTDRITRELDFDISSDNWPDDITTLHFRASVLVDILKAARFDKLECWFFSKFSPLVILQEGDQESEDMFVIMPLGNVGNSKPPLAEATK